MSDNVETTMQGIRERLAAATPGPWHAPGLGEVHCDHDNGVRVAGEPDLLPDGSENPQADIVADGVREQDAVFIANAPGDIRYLLDELSRERGRREQVEAERDRLHEELYYQVTISEYEHWATANERDMYRAEYELLAAVRGPLTVTEEDYLQAKAERDRLLEALTEAEVYLRVGYYRDSEKGAFLGRIQAALAAAEPSPCKRHEWSVELSWLNGGNYAWENLERLKFCRHCGVRATTALASHKHRWVTEVEEPIKLWTLDSADQTEVVRMKYRFPKHPEYTGVEAVFCASSGCPATMEDHHA